MLHRKCVTNLVWALKTDISKDNRLSRSHRITCQYIFCSGQEFSGIADLWWKQIENCKHAKAGDCRLHRVFILQSWHINQFVKNKQFHTLCLYSHWAIKILFLFSLTEAELHQQSGPWAVAIQLFVGQTWTWNQVNHKIIKLTYVSYTVCTAGSHW